MLSEKKGEKKEARFDGNANFLVFLGINRIIIKTFTQS